MQYEDPVWLIFLLRKMSSFCFSYDQNKLFGSTFLLTLSSKSIRATGADSDHHASGQMQSSYTKIYSSPEKKIYI